MQNQTLTPREIGILFRNRLRRLFLTFALIVLTIAVIADFIFLLGVMRDSDMPEWFLIPFTLGIVAMGAIIGIITYMPGKLKVVEKARFVRASIHSLLESKSITQRKLALTFNKVAGELINNSASEVTRGLVSEGWHETRAGYLTGLIESLIIRCEWDIDSEGRLRWFAQLLQKNRWQDDEVDLIISPVQALINKHGGRLTRSGIARSIARNILWIILTLILGSFGAWMLFTLGDQVDLEAKYEIVKFLLLGIPGIGVLVYNLVQIARKRRGV